MSIPRVARPIALPVLNNYRRQDSLRFAPGIESDPIISMDGIVGRNDTDFAAERFFPVIAPAKGKIELSGYCPAGAFFLPGASHVKRTLP
jgi:hypothetical protein